ARLPVDGRYFRDLFPAFVLGGAGLGLSLVPVTIAALTGVERSDAGIASGLINTSRQVGGAIGLAATSAIVATSTASAASLDHGLRTALVVLLGLALAGALIPVTLLRPPSTQPEHEIVALDEAA